MPRVTKAAIKVDGHLQPFPDEFVMLKTAILVIRSGYVVIRKNGAGERELHPHVCDVADGYRAGASP